MKYRKLELELRKIVEKRLREGWCVEPGLTVSHLGGCCIVGAIGVELGTDLDAISARDRAIPWLVAHGVESRALYSNDIEDGFEGREVSLSQDSELYAIGARIRRDYCEWLGSK